MHQHASPRATRFFDPGADGEELRLERVDAVVADSFDVEDFDPAFAFFDPEGALISSALPRGECGVSGIYGARDGRGGGDRRLRWGYESTFAHGDDVCDSEGVEHIYIRSMIPAYMFRTSLVTRCEMTYKFPRYKKGSTRLGKLPSNLASSNHV